MVISCKSKQKADLLLYGGKIYTADSLFSVQEAMVVSGGRILELGTVSLLRQKYEATETINLQGHSVYPGFIDAHCHFWGLSSMLRQADLTGSQSFVEIIERLKNHREKHPAACLQGRGWDQNLWPDKQFPDNRLLDSVFPGIPVVITRIDGHAALANSAALALAGITEKTTIEGGLIELRDGRLTGILLDKAADLMRSMLPVPEMQEQIDLLSEAQELCFRNGLTSVAEAGISKRNVELLDSLQRTGLLKIHLYVMLDPTEENFNAFISKGVKQSDRMYIGAVKLYADGALGSRGACLLKPYSDFPGHYGISTITQNEMIEWCRRAYKYGYQVCVHAIGDSAVRSVLNTYASVTGGPNNLRWRIEHCQIVDDADFGSFARFNIIPSVQPTHATSDMRWAGERLGDKRLKNAYACRRLLEQNGWLPLGTDFPIEGISPILTFYAAVFRTDAMGYPAGGFLAENALTRRQALLGITSWAARSCFGEKHRGQLSAGYVADFVILDTDIMEAEPADVYKAGVLSTWISGKKVWSRNQAGLQCDKL